MVCVKIMIITFPEAVDMSEILNFFAMLAFFTGLAFLFIVLGWACRWLFELFFKDIGG